MVRGMNLPDWITWPRMDWRFRAAARSWIAAAAVATPLVLSTWSTRPAEESISYLVMIPLVVFGLVTLLVCMKQDDIPWSPARRPLGEAAASGLLTAALSVFFLALKLALFIAFVAVVYRIVVTG